MAQQLCQGLGYGVKGGQGKLGVGASVLAVYCPSRCAALKSFARVLLHAPWDPQPNARMVPFPRNGNKGGSRVAQQFVARCTGCKLNGGQVCVFQP